VSRLLTAVALLLPALAQAHTPAHILPTTPFVVTTPKVSHALYGEFVTGAEVFVVKLSLDERFAVPVELFVPHEQRLRDHRPAWALVGPGLPAPNAEELAALPTPLPAGWGAIVDLNTVTPRPAFYEFVLRRFYWSSGALNVVLPVGPSELWIFCPARTTGKFGVGIGTEEGGGYLAAFADWSFYAY
jgi:hypothetical protein